MRIGRGTTFEKTIVGIYGLDWINMEILLFIMRHHGVPQGSILGPLFFIVFMNEFSRASDLPFSILFADDTTVFIEGQNYNNIVFTLNTELQKLDVWLQANKLTLNTAKTHYMVHRERIKSKTEKIIIRNNEIAAVKGQFF